MRWLVALAILAAGCGRDAATPVQVQIGRLDDASERVDALAKLEELFESAYRAQFALQLDESADRIRVELGSAVQAVLPHLDSESAAVRDQALATTRALLRTVTAEFDPEATEEEFFRRRTECAALLDRILRALSNAFAGAPDDGFRERCARTMEAALTRAGSDLPGPGRVGAPLAEAIDAAFAVLLRAAGPETAGMVRAAAISAAASTRREEAIGVAVAALRGPWKDVDCSSSAADALAHLGEARAAARAIRRIESR